MNKEKKQQRQSQNKNETHLRDEFALPKDVADPNEEALVIHTSGGEMPDVPDEGEAQKKRTP